MVVQKMKEIASRLGLFILVSLILMGVVLLWGMGLYKKGKSTHDQKEYIYLAVGYYIYKFDMDGNLIWKTGGKGSIGKKEYDPESKRYGFITGPDKKYGKFGEVLTGDSSLCLFWPPIGGMVVVDELVLAIDSFNYRIQAFNRDTGEFVRVFESFEGASSVTSINLLGKDAKNNIWYGTIGYPPEEVKFPQIIYKANKRGRILKRINIERREKPSKSLLRLWEHMPWGSIEIDKKEDIIIHSQIVGRGLYYFKSKERLLEHLDPSYRRRDEGDEATVCGIAMDHRDGCLYVLYTPTEIDYSGPVSLWMRRYTYPTYKLKGKFKLKEELMAKSYLYNPFSIDSEGNPYVVNEKNVICKFNSKGRLLKRIPLKIPPHDPYESSGIFKEIADYRDYHEGEGFHKKGDPSSRRIFMGAPVQWLKVDY